MSKQRKSFGKNNYFFFLGTILLTLNLIITTLNWPAAASVIIQSLCCGLDSHVLWMLCSKHNMIHLKKQSCISEWILSVFFLPMLRTSLPLQGCVSQHGHAVTVHGPCGVYLFKQRLHASWLFMPYHCRGFVFISQTCNTWIQHRRVDSWILKTGISLLYFYFLDKVFFCRYKLKLIKGFLNVNIQG